MLKVTLILLCFFLVACGDKKETISYKYKEPSQAEKDRQMREKEREIRLESYNKKLDDLRQKYTR